MCGILLSRLQALYSKRTEIFRGGDLKISVPGKLACIFNLKWLDDVES